MEEHNGLGALSMTTWQVKDLLEVHGHELQVRDQSAWCMLFSHTVQL